MSHYRIKASKKESVYSLALKYQTAKLKAKLLAARERAIRERGLPSAADLDRVAEEERAREATE